MQPVFLDLSRGGALKVADKLHHRGDLEFRQMAAAVGKDRLLREACPFPEQDKSLDLLVPQGVRNTDHGRIGNVGVRCEDTLHLQGADIFPGALDHVPVAS